MLEKDLQRGVIDVAKILGYRVMHTRSVWTGGRYRAPIQGHEGFPDLILCGNGRLLVRELKVGRNVLSQGQKDWLAELQAAGVDAGVWTDADWRSGLIEADLRRGTRHERESEAA